MRIRLATGFSLLLALCSVSVTPGRAQAPLLPGVIGSPAPAPAASTASTPEPAELPAPVAGGAAVALGELPAPMAPLADAAEPAVELGQSRSLRVTVLKALDAQEVAESFAGPSGTEYRWVPLLGTRAPVLGVPVPAKTVQAPDGPGTWRLEALDPVSDGILGAFTVLAPAPLAAKRSGYLNGYHIGTYPTEGEMRSDPYAPPSGFLEVTPQNQDLQISEHFRLKQFLTKDQFDVWPKYVVIDTRLIDKLELVIQELNRMGVRAERYSIMSGFRTPQYNGPGGDGRAELSRHMYGDAADGWVDNDGDGVMDDLNGDGVIDIRDAEIILRAVERVEQKHPELVGGCGLYNANDAHGPFVHIDARGYRARW